MRLVALDEKHFENALRWINDTEVNAWLAVGDYPISRLAERAWFDGIQRSGNDAAHFAIEVLGEGGHFLAKTFQGGTERDLLAMLKQHFRQVVHVKPASSRAESVEMFLLAKGFKGRKAEAAPESA